MLPTSKNQLSEMATDGQEPITMECELGHCNIFTSIGEFSNQLVCQKQSCGKYMNRNCQIEIVVDGNLDAVSGDDGDLEGGFDVDLETGLAGGFDVNLETDGVDLEAGRTGVDDIDYDALINWVV